MARVDKQKIRRWLDANGKQVPKGTPGATPHDEESRKWYGFNIPGQPRAVPLAYSKRAAQKKLDDMVEAFELGNVGINTTAIAAQTIPLKDQLEEWKQAILDKGTSAGQARQQVSRCQRTFTDCKMELLADLRAETVSRYLADRRAKPRAKGGLSHQTSNHVLQALKQFCNWLCDLDPPRLSTNPLGKLTGVNVAKDRRHDRVGLTLDELDKLLVATGKSPKTRCRLTGPARRMLYLCAAYSGLRAGTLAKLTVRNVELTTGRIHIPAGNMKAGRATLKPLHTVLRAELPAWLANRDPDSLLWPTRWLKKAARMLWRDLKDAGIPVQYKGHDGITRYRDFHALRHRLASELPKAGAGMKSAQSLLDHTDVRLTMNVYAHSDITTQASDLDLVPAPPSCQTQAKGLDPVALLASAYLLQQAILGAVLGMPTTPKQPEGN